MNKKFTISISEKCYKSKPNSVDYARMKFHQEELTLTEFVAKILQGYSFCHIFKNDKRSNNNFIYTNFACIDVDDSPISLNDFIKAIDNQPTIAYTTYSNGLHNLYAYRLLYFFNEKISSSIYPALYDSLCSSIGLNNNKDNCGRVLAQLMNGCSNANVEYFNTNIVYNITNFIDSSLPNLSLEYNNNTSIHISSKDTIGNNELLEDKISAIKLLNQDINIFITTFAFVEIISETKLDYKNGFSLLDDSYINLPVRFEWTGKKAKVNKFKDGERRRWRLYIDGLLIRKIKPQIKFVELLYNLVYRRKHYYDNSDGVLTNERLINIVSSVLQTKESDLNKITNTKHARFTTDKIWCTVNNISRRSYSRTVTRMLNNEEIWKWYDTSKSI